MLGNEIYLVDNGTTHLDELFTLLGKLNIQTLDPPDVSKINSLPHSLIVLTGGNKMSAVGEKDYYRDVVKLIKNPTAPIVGICLGMQLIAYAFDVLLTPVEEKIQAVKPVTILEQNHPIFDGVTGFSTYFGHRWIIHENDIKAPLAPMAMANNGYWYAVPSRSKSVTKCN